MDPADTYPTHLPLSTHSEIGATFSKTRLFHQWIPLGIAHRPLKGLGPIVHYGLKKKAVTFFPYSDFEFDCQKISTQGQILHMGRIL